MGLFDSIKNFKNILSEVKSTSTEIKEKNEYRKTFYNTYYDLGYKIIKQIDSIKKQINISSIDFQSEIFENALLKCSEYEEFVVVSNYSEEDFMLYQIDEYSTWVNGRVQTLKDIKQLSKTVDDEVLKLKKRIEQRNNIISWPVELIKDITVLNKWLNSLEESILDLKKTEKDDELIELNKASEILNNFRIQQDEWLKEANSFSKLVKEINLFDNKINDILLNVDTHRKYVRQCISEKTDELNIVIKIKQRKDTKIQLKKDIETMTIRRSQIENYMLKHRLNTHSKYRCRQALELFSKLELTGKVDFDYLRVKKILVTMNSAINNINYY